MIQKILRIRLTKIENGNITIVEPVADAPQDDSDSSGHTINNIGHIGNVAGHIENA